MQRTIKFRGQDFETGEWIYGSYNGVNAGVADVFIIYEKEIFDPVSLGFIDTEIVEKEVKEETVGQYTGLEDKNGTPVYEGDLVLMNPLHKKPHLIQWADGSFAAWSPRINHHLYEYGHSWEVIGNIWEHGHLLENESKKTDDTNN